MQGIQAHLWPLSGLLIGGSFIWPELHLLFIPGFVLFLFAIQTKKSMSRVFFMGVVVGTLIHLCVISWYWSTYPVENIEESSPLVQFLVIGIYSLITGLLKAPAIGFFAIAIQKISARKLVLLFIGPVLWVASEFASAFLFSIGTWGPGSTPSGNFSFGHIGYLLSENMLTIQAAKILGIYGLSYTAVFFCIALFIYIDTKMYKQALPTCAVILLLVLFVSANLFFDQKYVADKESVIAVETYFDKEFNANIDNASVKNDAVLFAVSSALDAQADVIILPEDSRFSHAFDTPDDAFAWISGENDTFKGSIIDSARTEDERGKTVQRAYIYDMQARSVYSFDKQYFVPQGEYLPYLFGKVIQLFVSEEKFEAMEYDLSYRQGVIHDSSALPLYLPAVLFCSESVAPFGVRDALEARHPSFVAHIISHAWFADSHILSFQLDSMLKVHAVGNGVPIVSAGNMSQSKLYLPTGEVRSGATIEEHALWKLVQFEL